MIDKVAQVVYRTCKDPKDIYKQLTPGKCHLIHMAMGISGEAGELLDVIKKHVIYNKELDEEHVKEEIGDLLYFTVGLIDFLYLNVDEIVEDLDAKLSARYKGGYSDKAAQERADKKETP